MMIKETIMRLNQSTVAEYAVIRCIKCRTRDLFCGGLCVRCYNPTITLDENTILNTFCELKYHKYFDKYFDETEFNQKQLNNALKIAIKIKKNNPVIKTLLFSHKFSPDALGYDFMLDIHIPRISQSILSAFFYKRFLIKTYIASYDAIDILPQILDPHMVKIDRSRSYTKFLIHDILFPKCKYLDDEYPRILSKDKFWKKKSMMIYGSRLYDKGNNYMISIDDKNGYITHTINGKDFYFVGKYTYNIIYDIDEHDVLKIKSYVK